MNVRLQGVEMYGGGPQNHYVFRAEAQRRRRTRNITILLAAILALLIVWFARTTFGEVAQPEHATAEQAAQTAQVVQADQQEEDPESIEAAATEAA